jgi:hypothetical protein
LFLFVAGVAKRARSGITTTIKESLPGLALPARHRAAAFELPVPGTPKKFVRLICDPEIGFVGFPRFEIIAGNEMRLGCAIEQEHRHDGFRHTSTDRNRAVILENHRFAVTERLGDFNSVFGLIDQLAAQDRHRAAKRNG